MNEQQFFLKREADWKRLNLLTEKADVSPTQLTPEELREVFSLYKRASSDLALARTKSNNHELIHFLNDLVARAYSILYRPKRLKMGNAIRSGLIIAAQTFRRRIWFVAVSFFLTIASGIFGYLCMEFAPSTKEVLIPVQMKENFDHWANGEMEERSFDEGVAGTAFYMSHNPIVSIAAATIAASTFGLGTFSTISQNGMMIGTLTHTVQQTGRVGYLYTRIMPHGVTELSGIIIAGGAGFMLGWSLLVPGRRTRMQSLTEGAKDGMVLLFISVVMMFMAAPIEGFFSFNPRVPDALKILFALLSALGWGFFWTQYGKDAEPLQN